jgi:hypothetical protein
MTSSLPLLGEIGGVVSEEMTYEFKFQMDMSKDDLKAMSPAPPDGVVVGEKLWLELQKWLWQMSHPDHGGLLVRTSVCNRRLSYIAPAIAIYHVVNGSAVRIQKVKGPALVSVYFE